MTETKTILLNSFSTITKARLYIRLITLVVIKLNYRIKEVNV